MPVLVAPAFEHGRRCDPAALEWIACLATILDVTPISLAINADGTSELGMTTRAPQNALVALAAVLVLAAFFAKWRWAQVAAPLVALVLLSPSQSAPNRVGVIRWRKRFARAHGTP